MIVAGACSNQQNMMSSLSSCLCHWRSLELGYLILFHCLIMTLQLISYQLGQPVLVGMNQGVKGVPPTELQQMLILYYIYCGSWCPIFRLCRNIMTHILSAEPGMRALSSFPTVNDPVKCLYCSTVKFLHEVEYTSLQQTILLLLLLHTSNHHFRCCSLTVT